MAKTLAEQLERSVDGIRSENWKLRRPFMEAMNSAGGGGVVGGATIGYADSVDSSPRSRGGESWDEPFPAAVAASKLRLMCSYGGRIVPRPTDRSLCYLGGDTRIVVVERHTTLADLSAKLSRNLLGGRSFTLKYQLPNEDLDSLISVTTDEDLDNMVDEYDRIVASTSASGGSGSSRSSRLRLFLFPSKPESSPSSIGSLLDDSKSENWFVDALNGAIGMDGLPRGLSADSSSVNCLLGLEDDSSVHSRSGISGVATGTGGGVLTEQEQLVLPRPDSSGKLARHGLDVQSVPDSPMVETASSFGSTSSAPCLSNLPPIRLRPDDRLVEQRLGGLEDHFSHMNISTAATTGAAAAPGQRFAEEGVFKDANLGFHNPSPPTIAIPASGVSSIENPSSKTYSDEDRSEQVAVNKPPQLQPPPQQKSSSADAVPNPELLVSRPIYHQERVPTMATGANPNPDPKREVPVSGYALQTMPPTEQQFRQPPAHTHQLQQQQQQQQQPQFIATNPNPQYIQHPATGTVLPFQAYYQMPIQHSQQSNPYDPQQLPVYYLPFRQTAPSPYNMPIATSLGDVASQGKQVPPSGPNLYRMAAVQQSGTAMSAAVPPLIHMAPEQGHPYTGMGYHVVHHHHPSQAPPASATAVAATYGYEYATDPSGKTPLFYTQVTSPGMAAPQYQAVANSTDMAVTGFPSGDGKPTRGA